MKDVDRVGRLVALVLSVKAEILAASGPARRRRQAEEILRSLRLSLARELARPAPRPFASFAKENL